MRQITLFPILLFIGLFLVLPGALSLAIARQLTSGVIESGLTPAVIGHFASDTVSFFHGLIGLCLIAVITFATTFLVTVLTIFHIFLRVVPLPVGDIAPRSKDEFVWKVYSLVSLFYFRPFLHADLLPTPVTRLAYIVLGAKVGEGSYFAGAIDDPQFVRVGVGSFTGTRSLLVPHVMEGSRLAHFPIIIGDRVTVGAGSIVLPGVTIGDDAIVGALSVVSKGTVIGQGEIWAGNPARFIRKRDEVEISRSFVRPSLKAGADCGRMN